MRILAICFLAVSLFPRAARAQASFEGALNSLYSSCGESRSGCGEKLSPELAELEMELENGAVPVIITVPGLSFGEIGWGPLEFKNFKKLISIFFHKKDAASPDFEKEFYRIYDEYLLANDVQEGDLPYASPEIKLPDNYLESKIKELPAYTPDMVIIPFPWSRDPGDSEKVIPVFEKKLEEVWNEYGGKKPIIIVAHSWGSVLMYNALTRLAETSPEVRINKLITMGSPLVPGNIVVKAFMALEIKKEDLEKRVSKPVNLNYWKNIWAERDMYSNKIPSADYNVQVDEKVEKLEPVLLEIILHNKLLRPAAKNDFLAFRDIKAWHSSYFFDYKAYLKSVKKEIGVEVFMPIVAPQLFTPDK